MAGRHCGSCSEYVICQEYMRRRFPETCVRYGSESPGHVSSLFIHIQSGLGDRMSPSFQQLRFKRAPFRPGEFCRDDFRLVVPSLPFPSPVERDRDHHIHIREPFRSERPVCQKPCEIPSFPEPFPVFESLRNLPVPRFSVIKEQCVCE